MIQRFISTETIQRFLKEFKKNSDCLREDNHVKYLSPNEAALIVDAINAWEVYRQSQFALTFYDQARIYPEVKSIPSTQVSYFWPI